MLKGRRAQSIYYAVQAQAHGAVRFAYCTYGLNLLRVCGFKPFRLCRDAEAPMDDAGIGWIAAIIIGGIAGWLAEKITGSNMGLITNIILGMIGAGIASWLFGMFGLRIGGPGWLGYLIAGFVGACLLILSTRLLYPDRWRT